MKILDKGIEEGFHLEQRRTNFCTTLISSISFRKGSQEAAAYSRWGLMNDTYSFSRVLLKLYL